MTSGVKPSPESRADEALSDIERDVLDFERQWWKFAGARDAAIIERFGISPWIYAARLNALIDRPEAEAYSPVVVHRLRRLREARRQARRAG